MRKHITISLLFFFIVILAQNTDSLSKPKKITVFTEIKGFLPVNTSDKYISKAYSQKIGYGIDFKLAYRNSYGLGVNYSNNSSDIKDKKWVGNFDNAIFRSFYVYAFYQYNINQKLNLLAKLGIGKTDIKHTGNEINNFRLKYHNSVAGLQINYKITPYIYTFGSTDFYFLKSNSLDVNSAERPFFTKSNYIKINIGFGFAL